MHNRKFGLNHLRHSLLSILILLIITFSGSVAAASLTGSYTNAPANVNLSVNSPADWTHWGYVPLDVDHKNGVTAQISNFTSVGGADPGATQDVSATYSWSDGIAPAGQITGTNSAERVFQVGKGFQFTVPANTTLKTLHVYVGAKNSTGKLTATLSDGSAPAYSVVVNQASGQSSREVTINFRANSGGQTLTVQYVVTAKAPSASFITLESAALDATGTGGVATLGGSMVTVSNVNLSAKGPTDWIHWGRIADAPLDRKAGITPLISDEKPVGGSSPFPHTSTTVYNWTDGQPTPSVSTNSNIRVFQQGAGFQFTAVADTRAKTLKVYVGLNKTAQGKLTAKLSDGSAPNYSVVINNTSGQKTYVVTINYQAASQGQKLTITYTRNNTWTAGTWIVLDAAVLIDGGGGGGGGGGVTAPASPP
ncbi:MAG: hypothetical protein ACE5EH_12360, partial [Gammaproteobacteria bacterium]